MDDILVCFISLGRLSSMHTYSLIIDSERPINTRLLLGNVLFKNPTHKTIDELLNLMTKYKDDFNQVSMITIASESKQKVIEYLKSKFTLIEAGGGIVEKGGNFLMIYRKGKWDIPKGKMEAGETPKRCACREVEEETCIKVKVGKKIGVIWHTYLQKSKWLLKKTHWFEMTCLDDSNMKAQTEESITEVKWMRREEMQEMLIDSYRSLRFLSQKYHQTIRD